MQNNELTEVFFVLDRSGSMTSIMDDTIGGFNRFISDQKKAEGRCKFTLVQFDDVYEMVLNRYDIHDVENLTEQTFVPRGLTALFDAIGKTIADAKLRIANASEDEKPAKVLFVILTDGGENASKEYRSKSQIAQMIQELKDSKEQAWEFIFLAANQDAMAEAGSYGISTSNAFTFATNSKDVNKSYDVLSVATKSFRMMSKKSIDDSKSKGVSATADLYGQALASYEKNESNS